MAVGGKFDISEAPALKEALKRAFDKAAKRGALAAGIKVVNHIQTVVIPGEPVPPVDRGIYRASWRATSAPYGADVANATSYAPIVEYGARAENIKPGRKMIDALSEWAHRKGIGDGSRNIAWAIARSMQKRGIFNRGKGLRILEKALRLAPQFLRDEIARELKKEFR